MPRASITLDSNLDGLGDRTFSGFSSFLGLNDLFVSDAHEYVYQSNVLSKTVNLGVRNPITIDFSTPTMTASINISPADNLQSIVDKINSDETLNTQLLASLVPNGSGYMLQITNSTGEQLEISERATTDVNGNKVVSGFLNRIGLEPSYSNMASQIKVREDIKINPNLLTVGTPEYNTNTGKYELNDGNNNVANKMAQVFAKEHTFGQAGSLAKMTTSLANYASTFVGTIATQTSNAATSHEYQSELISSLANKHAEISGVDSDQELANLIIYQQSYSACAQVWSATRELVDILFDAL